MHKEKNILFLLGKNESKIAMLYGLYAEKIRGRKKFWLALAKEERGHGEVIRELDERCRNEDEFLKLNRHARQIVSYISEFIDNEIKKAETERISHGEALASALRLEQSMIESKSFEIFEPVGGPVAAVFRKINRETKVHMKELRKMCKG